MLWHLKCRRSAQVVSVALVLVTGVGMGKAHVSDHPFASSQSDIVEEIGKNYFEKLQSRTLGQSGGFLYVATQAARDPHNEEIGGPPRAHTLSDGTLATAGEVALVASQGLVIDGEGAAGGETHSYEVQQGDTLSSIAEEFGISVDTIVWANDLTSRSTLREGARLTILPVDGVRHTVRRGETIASIAKAYAAKDETIEDFNNISDGALSAGKTIIVPGGKKQGAVATAKVEARSGESQTVYSLSDSKGYFLFPARGKITQGLHRYNAVDIGGSAFCNTPVYAAAAGTVIEAAGAGWNGGYGKYARISHPNGTVTLYGHAAQLFVSRGASVEKGEVIALMGSTGNSTGCHVHFEVRGAQNPFAY